ncbi:MAG: UDP-N-acetylmuramoyl-L-alanyl-D-glutamate--2,6-diaminopimelate ligase [Burkholderiaceae bacterium]
MTAAPLPLQQLQTPEQAGQWLRARVRGALHSDSRRVTPGDGFVAWPGASADGRQHVRAALQRGAAACLVEQAGAEDFDLPADGVASYAGLKAASGPIAAAFYGQASPPLDVVAITGTNGKTSSACWLAESLVQWQLQKNEQDRQATVGLAGTFGLKMPEMTGFDSVQQPRWQATGLTTPDPITWQGYLRLLADAGSRYCVVEASSIGLAEQRLAGTRIRVAVLTNFTQDHLDYHGSMQAYWQAKAALFAWPGLQAAVINIDDAQGAALADALGHQALDLWTVSCQRPARLQAQGIHYDDQAQCFTLREGPQSAVMRTALLGEYNVSNLLGVVAALRALGVPFADCIAACAALAPVPGRMQRLGAPGQPLVVVDYAHTPDALDKLLGALRPLARQRGGRLWCVFGCGGDRDRAKRPLMAAIAEKNADQVVVTSDNPRSERPEAIICQILLGLSHRESVHVQADRAQAIAQTLAEAHSADVVVLAGKGHEETQEIGGISSPFSDWAHAEAALQARRDAP